MKWSITVLIIGLGMMGLRAEDKVTSVDLIPDGPSSIKSSFSEVTRSTDGLLTLSVTNPLETNRKDDYTDHTVPLFRMQAPKIKASHFAIKGEVAYQNCADQSALEMIEYSTQGRQLTAQTNYAGGPQGRLAGTSDFRPFILPITRDQGASSIDQLDINLRFIGQLPFARSENLPQKVILRNLQIIEYPEVAVTTPQNPPPRASHTVAPHTPTARIEWVSFILGSVVTLACCATTLSVIHWSKRRQQWKHDREMRQMASLDG